MNELVKVGNLMSSKRIAEKTGKEHGNVLRDIRNMISELEKDGSKMNSSDCQVVVNEKNGLTSEIILNERLSLCLASGYSTTLRMVIIDDWATMKLELSKPKELSRKEILLLALESEERAIIAEQKVLELQPKADFYDTVTDSKDAIDLGATAKVLKLKYGRTTLFKNLRELGVLMKNNIPKQEFIDKEWFIVVESSWSNPNGDSHIYLKTLVLQKGLDGIRKLLKANDLD